DTYLYEEDDIIKGFICIINAEFIGAIFMDNKYRGFGIGTKLINFLKNKHEKLRLTVYKDNINSVSFYKAKGFNVMTEELDEATNSVEYLMEYNE
uniref:GNAT family N-acetyltransferase n=1 Tax=uncultured Clostridium sp. TaxID=59620 RepID=UPI002613960F